MFCLDCNTEFDEDDIYIRFEHGEAWGSNYRIAYECCPFCKSEEITNDYYHCDNCGSVCTEDYIITEDDRYYCSDCYSIHSIDN